MVDRKTEVTLVGAVRARQLPGSPQRPSPSLENPSFPLQTELSDMLACGGVEWSCPVWCLLLSRPAA